MFEESGSAQKPFGNYLSGDSSFLIDLVRVLACEMVVLCHSLTIYMFYHNLVNDIGTWLWKIDGLLATMGVTLFFFVSGIVIANSLFKKRSEGRYGFLDYFIDRFSRIYSGLIPCLAVILIIDVLIMALNGPYYDKTSPSFGSPGLSATTFAASLLMIQSVPPLQIPQPPFAEILWTLNIEWWLYMLFGWAAISFAAIKKLDAKRILVLAILALFPAYRLLIGPNYLVAIWFFGVLITLLLIKGKYTVFLKKHFKLLSAFFLLLTIIRIGQILSWGIQAYEPVIEVLVGCLLLVTVINLNDQNRIPNGRIKLIVKTMAKYSFTLYLTNMAVIGLSFACIDKFSLSIGLPGVIVYSLVVTNLIALAIAIPTEMQYKKFGRWIKARLKTTAHQPLIMPPQGP